MSNTDKTRQKLVNSMRKSKDAAVNAPAPRKGSAKTGSSAKTRAKPKKTAPAAPATGSKQDRPVAAKAATATGRARQAGADPYQSRGRVWPD